MDPFLSHLALFSFHFSRLLNMKDEYPRSFYYKLNKVFCEMLNVTCLCYGKMNKHDKTECIYGIDAAGFKRTLYVMARDNKRWMHLEISKHALEKDGMQKAIVKRIMKAVEKSNVFYSVTNPSCRYKDYVIPKGLCCERCVIEHDLRSGCKRPPLAF